MTKNFFFLFIIFFNLEARAEFCSAFKDCDDNESATVKSLPSSDLSTNFNSSNASQLTGFGTELVYLPHNGLGVSLLTGSGNVGAAFLSSNSENSFFGNRAIEIDEIYLKRRIDKKKYKTKKRSFALGVKIINEENVGFNIGLSVKRNSEIKKINPGGGISFRFGLFNMGASLFINDTKIELGDYVNPRTNILYKDEFKNSTYEESFLVKTFSAGLHFGFLSLDAGLIRTKYDFFPNSTSIVLLSGVMHFEKFNLNLAHRAETSDNLKEKNGKLHSGREKKDIYGGGKYLLSPNVHMGLAYNLFLVNDISFRLTILL